MSDDVRIGWLGHGTVLVEIDGARLLVDPVLRRRIVHLRRHAPLPPHPRGAVDAVLVTHLHHDHLDFPSLASLGRGLPVIVPRGAAGVLRRRGYLDVRELAQGESLSLDGVLVEAVHADHPVGRPPLGPRVQPLGYVVSRERRVYLAGDTDLYDAMRELRPLAAAVLPVGGWGPTLGPGHLDPEAAVEALLLLEPELAIPVHYGTYAPLGGGAPSLDPGLRFARLAAERAPGCRVVVLEPGGTVTL